MGGKQPAENIYTKINFTGGGTLNVLKSDFINWERNMKYVLFLYF